MGGKFSLTVGGLRWGEKLKLSYHLERPPSAGGDGLNLKYSCRREQDAEVMGHAGGRTPIAVAECSMFVCIVKPRDVR
jgi:hypothetical protein